MGASTCTGKFSDRVYRATTCAAAAAVAVLCFWTVPIWADQYAVDQATGLDPDSSPGLLARAWLAHNRGKIGDAADLTRDALRTATTDAERIAAYKFLEHIYNDTGDHRQLDATFRAHLDFAPDPLTKHNYADLLVRCFRYDDAIEMEKSVLREVDLPAAHHTLATAYRSKADQLNDARQHAQKVQLYQLALAEEPTDASAREALARMARGSGSSATSAPAASEPTARPLSNDQFASPSLSEPDLRTYMDQLRSSNSIERAAAVQALGKSGAAATVAVAPLVALASRSAGTERSDTILAVAAIAPNDPAVIKAAVDALPSMDQAALTRLLPTLKRVGAPAVAAVLDALAQGRTPRHAGESLILQGADFGHQDAKLVDAAASRLGAALRDPDSATRVNAARTLAAFGAAARAAVPALTEALRDKNPQVRGMAAATLGAVGAPATPAVPALTSLLADEVPQVTNQARLALQQISSAPRANR